MRFREITINQKIIIEPIRGLQPEYRFDYTKEAFRLTNQSTRRRRERNARHAAGDDVTSLRIHCLLLFFDSSGRKNSQQAFALTHYVHHTLMCIEFAFRNALIFVPRQVIVAIQKFV